MNTQGHLQNNGGIRGHSAGILFPLRVLAQGQPHKINGLQWIVVLPDGMALSSHDKCEDAHQAAIDYLEQY